MRFASYREQDTVRGGVVIGEEVFDLAAMGEPAFSDVRGIVSGGEKALSAVRAMLAECQPGTGKALESVELLAPLPEPKKNIFCIGRNYLGHVEEGYRARGLPLDLPKAPQIFTKPPTALAAPNAALAFDRAVSEKMDYEGELGIVIGKAGRNIAPEDALEHVFGYTVINDLTARDLQRRHDQWFKGKGLDHSCPMGPWIITRDEIEDLGGIRINTLVNGQTRQSATVAQMIFDIPTIIAELSRGMTLEAGDIIATGTPEGVGYAMTPPQFLADGDIVQIEIAGVGMISNLIELR